eukprot:12015-Pyramimonas_sp.AAC.1
MKGRSFSECGFGLAPNTAVSKHSESYACDGLTVSKMWLSLNAAHTRFKMFQRLEVYTIPF